MRSLARSIGPRFQTEIEQSITAAHRKSSPATLRIHTGAPLSLFDPAAWVATCTEFFYGDCAPNLQRPAKISWRRLFRYLMNREELEYHLDTDTTTYRANPDSRWNTPEFAALFVDAVRKLQVLQSTKGFFEKHSRSFAEDIRVLAKAKDKDFEAFQANLQQAVLQNTSITGLISEARQQGSAAVQKTLQHMLMHTANAAMTEGNKMAIRHMGQAMNTRFGPFSSFFTSNFADTYHVLTQVLAQGAFEPLGWRPLNILQDSPPMPTSQEMHKIVAARPMVQANLFLLLDALTHQHLLCTRRVFLGKEKYDPSWRWAREPYVEDDFSSSGDFGVAALVRSLIKALEAQGRGFAHGHEKTHSEPRTKAIDLMLLLSGKADTGAADHRAQHEETLSAWMEEHRAACLRDATTKQYDSAVESARQFGCAHLKEVFTAEERKRCRLDGGQEEDGTQRDDVEIVPAPEPAHVLREKDMAAAENRPMRHRYKGMPLTGAPAARFPLYLQAHYFDRYPDLDASGHAPETLDVIAPEHDGCPTGWIDTSQLYVTSPDGSVEGFRKANGAVATAEELQADARRYSENFAADGRFCHTYNHTHECKPTCFKNTEYKKPSDAAAGDTSAPRRACRFRFWRLVKILGRLWRRSGKALVKEPTVAGADDANNEYGRCKVCRENCCRSSSNDLCQVCLRCNVDLQYQVRTFPRPEQGEESDAMNDGGAAERANPTMDREEQTTNSNTASKALPAFLRLLSKRTQAAKDVAMQLLTSFAIAMRSSHVADFYATKYLAKPQQWLTSVLGPLIAGFRRLEEKAEHAQEHLQTKAQALRNVRTAIFAANRCVWISCCEACLYLQTESSAVQSHLDVVVHGRKGLFMMHECKRILNHEVTGHGLWQADLSKCTDQAEGDCLEVHAQPTEDNASTESEENDKDEEDAETQTAADHTKAEQAQQDAENVEEDEEMTDAAELTDTTAAAEHYKAEETQQNKESGQEGEGTADAAEHTETPCAANEENAVDQKKTEVQIFQITISLRDDWLHRGDALQDMDLQTYAEHIERKEKPMRGTDMQKTRVLQMFAFDTHYKLAARYVQVLKPAHLRCIARFNMPNCLRESVNEGEENAQFKAFHCSLLRCPGPGQCADPLMCANALFRGKDGKYRFRPSWRARESEIITLAMRGQEKKMRARRLETLHDTSLCKVQADTHQSAEERGATEHSHEDPMAEIREASRKDPPKTRIASMILQIDIQRLFRQRIRSLRESALADSPCVYGYPERMVQAILGYVGTSLRDDCVCLRGIPPWHMEQLHVAEWQALQQLEFLFNLTLSVDAKNMALEKLKVHKGSTLTDAEAFETMKNPLNTCGDEDPGPVADDDLIPPDEPVVKGALLPPITDQNVLLAVLGRSEEVALARQPGQGRREALQNMREIADAFGSPKHLQTNGHDPSVFGAAEHEKKTALARHKACLEMLRAQQEKPPHMQDATDEATGTVIQEADVELLHEADEDSEMLGPVAFAKRLCDKAELTLEQKGPVALIVRDMQKAYEKEMQRRGSSTETQSEAYFRRSPEQPLLPLKGRIARLLLYGGGGCGKTRIINLVLTPLFRRFYGTRGLVLTAFANKPARLIKGKTSHSLAKIRGAQSLTMPRLRVKSDKERRALAAVWAPVGAMVKDEFTQQPATLEHAIAVRATYGREQSHNLRCADYAQPETNYASIPFVITAGDPLQFPPVPATSSLLAEPEGQSKEHRIAQSMFEHQDYVCELKTTMRFRSDPVLSKILQKMRTPGEDRSELRLTMEEWRALQCTDIAHGASLEGTELWYHSAFAWSYVCMAQWIRSVNSAAHHQQTLFLCAARDYIQNVEARDLEAVRDQLLKVPNMNTTGRLPAVALLHVHMKVRITITVCPCQAPVDTTGTIKHIELDSQDRARWQQQSSNSIFLLRQMPTVLVQIDDDITDTGLGPGVLAVEAMVCEPFATAIEIPDVDERSCRARSITVRAVREQVPLTIATATTLYTLQGTTATPGLIHHFRTPRRISKLMKWISTYMALSRVQSLSQLRSIGLTTAIRDLIDEGPPPGMLTRFLLIFEEKALETERLMREVLQELDWISEDA